MEKLSSSSSPRHGVETQKPKVDRSEIQKTPPKVVKAKPKFTKKPKPKITSKIEEEKRRRRRRHKSDDLTPKKKVILRRHYSDNRFDAADLTDLLARRPISASLLTLPPLSSRKEDDLSSPPCKETALKPSPSSPLNPISKVHSRACPKDLPLNLDLRLSEMMKEKYPTTVVKKEDTTSTATTERKEEEEEKKRTTNKNEEETQEETNNTTTQTKTQKEDTTKKTVRDMYMDVARRFTTNFFWKDPLGVRDHRHLIDILLAPPEMGEALSSDGEEEEEEEEEEEGEESTKNLTSTSEILYPSKPITSPTNPPRRRVSTFSNFLSSMFTPTKPKPKGAYAKLSEKIEKYVNRLKNTIKVRKKAMESVHRSQKMSERERENQMRIADEWHLRRDVRGIIESRGLHVMQLLNHMEHIHRIAIETMERRITITNGFQQYVLELKSDNEEDKESTAKRLLQEQRKNAFFDSPRTCCSRGNVSLAHVLIHLFTHTHTHRYTLASRGTTTSYEGICTTLGVPDHGSKYDNS
jgi:hypothetical protein